MTMIMTFKSHFVCFLYDYTVPFKSHVAKVKAYVQRTLCILGDLILFFPFSIYSNKYWRYAYKPTYQNYLQILKNSFFGRNFDMSSKFLPEYSTENRYFGHF